MEGNTSPAPTTGTASAPRPRRLQQPRPAPLADVIVKRPRIVPTVVDSQPATSAPTNGRGLGYTFIPYPTELADMERRGELSPTKLRILTLRRFAHPISGEFATSTQEVAELIGVDRSTAHKALWALERTQFIHLRRTWGRTVRLTICFGGFREPFYKGEGKSPLRWDADGTVAATPAAQRPPQIEAKNHSSESPENGLLKPETVAVISSDGTVPRTIDVVEDRNNNDYVPTAGLTTVDNFVPQSHDEAVVQGLARKLGERNINDFRFLRRTYGLHRLQRACGMALDKARDTRNPLRGTPGAYARWLLENGMA